MLAKPAVAPLPVKQPDFAGTISSTAMHDSRGSIVPGSIANSARSSYVVDELLLTSRVR